jgi:hypothetical protein
MTALMYRRKPLHTINSCRYIRQYLLPSPAIRIYTIRHFAAIGATYMPPHTYAPPFSPNFHAATLIFEVRRFRCCCHIIFVYNEEVIHVIITEYCTPQPLLFSQGCQPHCLYCPASAIIEAPLRSSHWHANINSEYFSVRRHIYTPYTLAAHTFTYMPAITLGCHGCFDIGLTWLLLRVTLPTAITLPWRDSYFIRPLPGIELR